MYSNQKHKHDDKKTTNNAVLIVTLVFKLHHMPLYLLALQHSFLSVDANEQIMQVKYTPSPQY